MSKALKTWSKFTRCINGVDLKFKIQEVSPKSFENILQIFDEHFIDEESTCKLAGVPYSKEARNEYKIFKRDLRDLVPGRFQVDACCIDDESDMLNIVAVSIMILITKNDQPESTFYNIMLNKMKTTEMKNLLKLLIAASFKSTSFKDFNIDRRYSGFETVVTTGYRGLGIAEEMYKARITTCKEYNVPVINAWMTTPATQKAAANRGWLTVEENTFEELARKAGVKYNGVPVLTKMMITKVF